MKIAIFKDMFGLIRPLSTECDENKYMFHHCSNGATAVTQADYKYVETLLTLHGVEIEFTVEK
jgi:hypothetical protein